MSAFTPGPWRYEADEHGQHHIYGGVFPGAQRASVEIADVWFIDCDEGEQLRAANAALIAAAPDLYDALQVIDASTPTQGSVDAMQSAAPGTYTTDVINAMRGLANIGDVARAALSAAKGETK